MRLIKLLGLSTVAALAAMAFVGASSASAGPTALCSVHFDPCPPGYEQVGHFEALAVDVSVLTQAGTVLCAHSNLLGYALNLGNPLVIHLTYLDFLNCTLGGNPCEITTLETGLALLLRVALNTGNLQLHNTSFLVVCAGLHCIYGGLPTLQALGHNYEANQLATIHANQVPLERLGGLFCMEGAQLDALYIVLLPHPVYIVS